jgi:hypothetical protein
MNRVISSFEYIFTLFAIIVKWYITITVYYTKTTNYKIM